MAVSVKCLFTMGWKLEKRKSESEKRKKFLPQSLRPYRGLNHSVGPRSVGAVVAAERDPTEI